MAPRSAFARPPKRGTRPRDRARATRPACPNAYSAQSSSSSSGPSRSPPTTAQPPGSAPASSSARSKGGSMVESMFPPGPINPRQLDPERVNGLLAHGVETHPNRAEVDRFLRAGAEFIVGRADDDPELLRVRLVMTDKAPAMAELRASIAGTTAPGTAS